MMSSFILGNERVNRLRKKPKETYSKAKTIRKPFGKEPVKVLSIPNVVDRYNYYIGAVEEFDLPDYSVRWLTAYKARGVPST